jgi:hypothetical protein
MRQLLLFSMVGFAACNDHIAAEDFSQRFAQTFCAAQIDCGLTDGTDRATCERLMTDRPPPNVALAPGELASGIVRFDEDAAHRCLAGLAAYACHSGRFELPNACSGVFTVTTAVGAPCGSGYGCASDQTCQFTGSCGTCAPAPGVGETCTGTCVPHARCLTAPDGWSTTCVARLAAGQPCSTGDLRGCDDGLACIASPDGSGGTCQGPRREGQPCAPYFLESETAGGFYAPSGACLPGLVCDFTRAQPVCAAPAKIGQPCGAADGCESGLYCTVVAPGLAIHDHVVSLAPNQGVCVAPRAVGAACDSSHYCQTFESCNGTCVRAPVLGEACPIDAAGLACAIGYCDTDTHVCVPAGQPGDPCDPQLDHCGIFLSCDSSTHLCTGDAQRCH